MSSNNLIAVFGDVHGCYFTLKNLYHRITKITTEVYSVGDLIDRGKFSRETVQFCIDNGIKPVRGNHEEMLLNAIKSYPDNSKDFSLWEGNGANNTMMSYISSFGYKKFKEFVETLKECRHLDFIKSLPIKYELEKVVITHAGIIKNATEQDILWNRYEPIDNIGKLQIFGHTPQELVKLNDENNSINIDTGCVYGRFLSSVIIDKTECVYTKILTESVKFEDIDI